MFAPPDTGFFSRRRFLHMVSRLLAAVAAYLGLATGSRAATNRYDDLRTQLSGEVITRVDRAYEAWRKSMSWQLRKPRRRPDVIVQPASIAEVMKALTYARDHGMRVSTRSGGHSWVHSAVRNGGMLLDLRRLREIAVNVEERTAKVGPGVISRELATVLERYHLAFPVAHCGGVAMGGYLLGGGQGWNWASWGGVACNSVAGIDIISAAGERLFIDEFKHPELYWAARGAGPGFPGIVVRYHLNLYELPRAITTSTYTWPLQQAVAVADWLPTVVADLSDRVEVLMYLVTLPTREGDVARGGARKACVVSATAFVDSEEEAHDLLRPITNAEIVDSSIESSRFLETPFHALFATVDQSYRVSRAAADTFWFDQPLSQIVEKFVDHFDRAPSNLSMVLCEVKPNAIHFEDAAYSMRRRTFVAPYAFWLNRDDDTVNLRWMKKAQSLLSPLAVGYYINEVDLEASPERARKSFSEASWKKIRQVREKHDPEGMFFDYLGSG